MEYQSVEATVAQFLGGSEINWEKLKPVISFVVLWNNLERQHDYHLSRKELKRSVSNLVQRASFDITRYEKHIRFFRERYAQRGNLYATLFRNGEEPDVNKMVDDLLDDVLTESCEIVAALLMIPYRIRNNLFHGNKRTFELYDQVELFEHVNEILNQFYLDLIGQPYCSLAGFVAGVILIAAGVIAARK